MNQEYSTLEQQEILDSVQSDTSNVIVDAVAGSGKTYLLRRIGLEQPLSTQILYLSFSRYIGHHQQTLFSNNVKISTLNAFAYEQLALHKLKRKTTRLTTHFLEQHFSSCLNQIKYNSPKKSWFILNTINSFCSSSEHQITTEHLPDTIKNKPNLHDGFISAASRIFKGLLPFNGEHPLIHDIYYKYWHLLKAPGLEQYDLVLMDEGQDSTPLTVDILKKARRVILVGDQHQNIFSFRGSISAMDNLDGKLFSLTQSFRFGDEIANLANQILKQKFRFHAQTVKGLLSIDSRIHRLAPSTPHTRIFRTNYSLVNDALLLLSRNIKVGIIGNLDDLLSKIYSAWAIRTNNKNNVKMYAFYSRFKTWRDFVNYGEQNNSTEIRNIASIINDYLGYMPRILQQVKHATQTLHAPVILVSVYRAKGLEFSNVVLADDFDPALYRSQGSDENLNLAYTAVTRTKYELELRSRYLGGLVEPPKPSF